MFELWRRIGSARQVVSVLRDEGQRVPRRTVGSRRVRWASATYGSVHAFLTNPAYAGAFVFGRTSQKKQLDATGRVRRRTIDLPLEQWSVCLPEHHPGYVTWEEYLATRERLRQNVRPRGEGGGAAREGVALLQGIVRCGRCGRRMQVAYSGNDGQVPRYACVRAHQLHGTDSACQSLGATQAGEGRDRRVPGSDHPGRRPRLHGGDRRTRAPARGSLDRPTTRGRAMKTICLLLCILLLIAACAPAQQTAPTSVPTPPATAIAVTPVAHNADWTPVVQNFKGVDMVLVPPGCFTMGNNQGRRDERPESQICFEKPFWIDRTEVTNAQYGSEGHFPGAIARAKICSGRKRAISAPSEGARLPTEAEWEYAARGPNDLIYPWGNN